MKWTPHATIAKQSVAVCYYEGYKDFVKDRHRYTLPYTVIESICYRLFNNDQDYYFGDYLFKEIELNAMHKDECYYDTLTTIPIPCHNQRLVPPEGFHPIRRPPLQNQKKQEERIEGELPERKEMKFTCPDCNAHFSSERQLNRHARCHQVVVEVKEEKPLPKIETPPKEGPFLLKVADGEMELSREEV